MQQYAHCPIVLLSFNRVDYLRAVLKSLSAQISVNLADRPILFFQDGAVNRFSKKEYALQVDIESCVAAFKEFFPDGQIFLSDVNLGIALNFDRAESYVFEHLKASAAIFFEDDLVLSESYLAVLEHLLVAHADDPRVGYVAAYGDHTLPMDVQIASQNRLMTMHHNWGFGVYRRQWELMRPRVEAYLALVKQVDYRDRDGSAIAKLFASWGFGTKTTSQDAAKTLACCLAKTIKINTTACFARYIGETGVHMNSEEFELQNYAATFVHQGTVREFEPLTDNLYHQIRADLVHWGQGGRIAAATSDPDGQMQALDLFHTVNRLARRGTLSNAICTASSAVETLFLSVMPDKKVAANFHLQAKIRDLPNESHIRFDIRGNSVRVLCPVEMITPQFTNYFYAFVVASQLLAESLKDNDYDGGLTMDLANDARLGSYKRVSFSSSLLNSELVIDPGFHQSDGYCALRAAFKDTWKLWQDRENIVFWRGDSSGVQDAAPEPGKFCGEISDWTWLQRLHLCAAARKSKYADRLDVGLSQIVQISASHLLSEIATNAFLRGPETESDYTSYRYIIALDGNTSVGTGLIQALLSGACVFLVESRFRFRSWFYDRMVPGETHISISADLSNLDERLTWAFENPEYCERIALRGNALALSMSVETEVEISVGRFRKCILP